MASFATDAEGADAAGPLRDPHSGWAASLDRIIGPVVEFPAALLVLAEVVVLLMGVIWRYVLHKPLIWSDELASILFLWLAMLGSVVALRRGEHMRMTAIVGALSPRARAFLDLIAIAAALAFLALVLRPAIEFAEDEVFVTTPALEIANSWRAAALPIGIGLMIVTALLQLFRRGSTGRDQRVRCSESNCCRHRRSEAARSPW